jgi:phosphoribosylanthranilate isomerase
MAVHVKICGITNPEDARVAVEAGADALGLVFAPSPRRVTIEQAQAIRAALPSSVELVGVFVAEDFALVAEAMKALDLGGVQFHKDPQHLWTGCELRAFEELRNVLPNLRVITAIRAKDIATLHAEIASRLHGATHVLLDAYVPGLAGGTGKTFDWKLVDTAKTYGRPVIVAGGLTPENVSDAVRRTHPWGVDVSSGVEAEPGRKDHEAVRRFIAAVRATDSEDGDPAPAASLAW